MFRWLLALLVSVVLFASLGAAAEKARPARRYFAHPAVEDQYGVVAPWYQGQNGPCDWRVRVAAETLKRYPWADKDQAVMAAPHFVFNGHWAIAPDGTISVDLKLPDWHNGDIGQRSASLLFGLTDYYRYTGDPAAIGLVTLTADFLVDHCQTPADHPWPRFLISCPTKGKAYGQADPHGFIQLDVAAQVGSGMVAAFQLTGNPRYLEAIKHWADLLAEHCDGRPGAMPWNRYANPEDSKWDTRQTAGVSLICQFLDDMIRLGHRGQNDSLVRAREAGDKYLREVLLPEWSRDPTWGHHFWDWLNPVATCSLPCFASHYMMNRPEAFPAWETDIRNVLSLFFCRSSVNPESEGDVYSGAWAFPESSGCCKNSLQYPTMNFAATLARYAALTGSPWAREVARRQSLLVTYDAHETGVVEDAIHGGAVVAGNWFNLAHPWPLRCTMQLIAWQPEFFAPSRENHIVRTTSVVRSVTYGKGRIAYQLFPLGGGGEEVLRLAFQPASIRADGKPLQDQQGSRENGYQVRPLSGGDCLVTIRHAGAREVVIEGDDPQEVVQEDKLQFDGEWAAETAPDASSGSLRATDRQGASASFTFQGNQVRLVGRVCPEGGKADVYLDGVKQLCGVDFWCPETRDQQIVFYHNGLAQGKHTLKLVATGLKNPVAKAARVYVDAVQWSDARGTTDFGEGSGPNAPQRVIFGYVGRKDYADSQGRAWRPATEFIMPVRRLADLVPESFWTEPQLQDVAGTPDPELYRYGVYGRDFTSYFTVNPKLTYSVRLKFCEAQRPAMPGEHATTIDLQGKTVVEDLDIAATANGVGKAVDLVFNGVRSRNGVIAIRFWHRFSGRAMVQAIEVEQGESPPGAKPVRFEFPAGTNHLVVPSTSSTCASRPNLNPKFRGWA